MIYTLAGIVVICLFLCFAELIVRIWEKIEEHTERMNYYAAGKRKSALYSGNCAGRKR